MKSRRPVWLKRRYGNPAWDFFLRGTGAAGILAILVASLLPETAVLAGFVLVTVIVNGPQGPLFPATYEPILMLFGRVYSPVLVAALAACSSTEGDQSQER